MRFTLAALALAMFVALPGCVGSTANSLGSALAQLKDDHATVCIKATGIWGTVEAIRTNQDNSTVKGCEDIGHGINVAAPAPSQIAIVSPAGTAPPTVTLAR